MKDYELENELKQLTCPDDLVEEISEGYPVLDDAAKERIFKLCEKKMGENMKKDKNIEMNTNEDNENVEIISGVENYQKPKWYTHVLTIAASLLLVAGVVISVAVIKNGNFVEPATQLEASDTEAGEYSFEAVVIEENPVGHYIVTPLVDEEERKSSDKFSITAEPGIHTGEVVKIYYDGYIQAIYPSTVKETKVERVSVESPDEAVCNYISVLHPGSDISNGAVSVGQYDRVGFMYTYSPLAEQFGITEDTAVHAPIVHYTADGTDYSEMMIVMSGDYGFYVIDHFDYEPQEMTATVTEVLETGYGGSVQYYMVLPEYSNTEMKVYSVAQLGNYDTGDATNVFNVGEKVAITYNGAQTYGTALRYAENSETMVFSMMSLDEAEAFEQQELEAQMQAQQEQLMLQQQELEREQQALKEEIRNAEQNEQTELTRQEIMEIESQMEEIEKDINRNAAEAAGVSEQVIKKLVKDSIYCRDIFMEGKVTTEGGAVDGNSLYQVSPSLFKNYAEFEKFVRSVYCDEVTDNLLSSCNEWPGAGLYLSDKPRYVEYDGMLCMDKSIVFPLYEFVTNWFEFELVEINSFGGNTCEFTIIETGNANNVPIENPYSKTFKIVLDDGNWKLAKAYF